MPGKSKQQTKTKDTSKTADPQTAVGAAKSKAPKEPPPPPKGLYPDLGIKDETKEFGALASGDRTKDINGAIVHRTESPTMESTRNSYRDQISKGKHVGAHYLVGKEGETSLTVPTDKVAAHVRGNKDDDWKGANAWSVGIENVGMPTKINPKGDIRKQVEAMELPPAMRKRLLAMDDKALKAELAGSDNEMHGDITGPQKRANWNLVGALSKEHKFDVGTNVQPHEGVDHKTLGEGEPIKEFLTARQSYPERVAQAEKKLADMAKDPAADPKKLAELQKLVEKEKATAAALAVDKTPAENNALEGERVGEKPGPATEREGQRNEFYKDFWKRSQGLDAANAP